jgi:hypothetical protein
MTEQANAAQTAFNDKAQKIVNWEELRHRRQDIFWQEMTLGEKLFEAFVDVPYKMGLFVRQALGEAYEMLKRKPGEPEPVRGYADTLSNDIYIPKATFDAETAYALKHGLNKKFQERAAKLSQKAFDECRDFSVLKKTGQLRPFP